MLLSCINNYRAGDGNWTHDLILTKDALYPWATPATLIKMWSGKRGSNSRPSAWKADALPTELLPQVSGRRWIRTTEDISQQIYSLPHLATLVFSQYFIGKAFPKLEPIEGFEPTTPRLQITCSGQLSYIGGISMNVPFRKGIAKIGINSDYPKLF